MRRRNLKFYGYYYGDSNGDKNFRKESWQLITPVSDKTAEIQNESGKIVNGHVIADSSKYGISNKYLAFLEGDNAYTVITNKEHQGFFQLCCGERIVWKCTCTIFDRSFFQNICH